VLPPPVAVLLVGFPSPPLPPRPPLPELVSPKTSSASVPHALTAANVIESATPTSVMPRGLERLAERARPGPSAA
jgi:hypothetical protein